MADELTSNVTEAPVPAAPSSEQAQPVSGDTSTAPQSQPGGAAPQQTSKEINLFELPQFRAFQSQQTRTVNQLQQRLAQAESAVREARVGSMDELERAKYERDEAFQRLQQYEVALRDTEIQRQKLSDLNDIAQETGVPIEQLYDSGNLHEAWLRANKFLKQQTNKQAETKAQELARKQEANRVDVGGGAPSTATTRWEEQMREAVKKKDTRAYVLGILRGES